MKKFEFIFNRILQENNVAGGLNSVFGTINTGEYGNQFPSQNDSAYNKGDARVAKILGGKKKIQRRQQIPLSIFSGKKIKKSK